MEQITSLSEHVSDNRIIADAQKSSMDGSKIIFNGSGNILVVEDGVKLSSSTVLFNGSNAVCYLSASKNPYYVNLTVNNSSCIFFGRGNYINGKMTLITSEQQNIIIGDDGLFSFGIFIRTADPHLMYDCGSGKRINPSKSVFIGDHVWIGQNVLILKGTAVGSGSVIGGAALLSGKSVPSNTVCGGNPAKIIRRGVFFSKECVHTWTDAQTEKYNTMKTDRYTYRRDSDTVSPQEIDSALKACRNSDECLAAVKKISRRQVGQKPIFYPGYRERQAGKARIFQKIKIQSRKSCGFFTREKTMSIERVREYFRKLGIEDRVMEIDESSATVALAAKALGCEEGRIAKTISFSLDGEPILIVAAGDTKIDNAKYKSRFGKKAKMLSHEEAAQLIGHAVGGVCPFAVNDGVKIYLDESLKRFDTVYPACGSSNSMIELTPAELEEYSKPESWVDVCKPMA